MVTDELVRGWEEAYRRYGVASDVVARSHMVDGRTAREMSIASQAVASAWRALVDQSHLPWWVLAATESAAEAFDEQAAQWYRRAQEQEVHAHGAQSEVVPGAESGREYAAAWFSPGVGSVGDLPRS